MTDIEEAVARALADWDDDKREFTDSRATYLAHAAVALGVVREALNADAIFDAVAKRFDPDHITYVEGWNDAVEKTLAVVAARLGGDQ